MSEVPGSEFELPADLVFLAMGFGPQASVLETFGVGRMRAATSRASTDDAANLKLPDQRCAKVFAAGDMRRGVDEFLMGESLLPR